MSLTQKLLTNFSARSLRVPLSTRFSSYVSSEKVRPLEEYPEVEVIHNPPEWKYVERLLPKSVVPEPIAKTEYPSGWKPSTVGLHNVEQFKYIVVRSRNHMLPVYMERTFRGQRRVTLVKNIQGDIWQLEKELRQAVEKVRSGKLCATRVNEMSGQIRVHGDYEDVVRDFLKSKGY